METGPAREAVLKTYPSAVAWELEAGDRPYRPDGIVQLGFLLFGLGIGFISTGFYAPAGAAMALAGAAVGFWRLRPACERDPIFRGGRSTYLRISSRRDLRRMAVSQGSALATGYALAGLIVLLFVRNEPAWGIGLIVTAAASFAFTLLVFQRIARRQPADTQSA